ncbi:hypothetical protein F9C11_20390 [Amycolatopsis sp. VS8301801F10]|uniref:hypothetical protein n=1 Tax=unclassified Amycolatopsis TaxID=2618356 RepID=UPI0038FC9453
MTDQFYERAEQLWRGMHQRFDAITGRAVPLTAADRVDIAKIEARLRAAEPAPEVERCGLTELPTDQCSHCRPGGNRRPATIAGRSEIFTASYPGRCCVCREQYRPGDTIERREDSGYNGPCCARRTP